MCYSIEPKDQIYVKGYGFLYFAKNIGKTLSVNIVKNFLIVPKKLQRMYLKLFKTEQFKKQQKQLVIY